MKYILSIVTVIIVVGVGMYLYTQDLIPFISLRSQEASVAPSYTETATTTVVVDKTKTVIGTSAGGRTITAYHFGEGAQELLFIGGIHGGFAWNTVLVAYELMDYLKANPMLIATSTRVTVIPVMNPDGLFKVVGTAERFTASQVTATDAVTISGRFNGSEIDLNRNFDCDWQANAKWQTKTVSGGTKAFSEPESQAIQAYVTAHRPTAAVVWYSAAGGVFASNCHGDVLEETKAITAVFSKASGYKAFENFDFYEITGDMVNWFAKENIPAISVLLTNHKDTEWDKNQKGIDALLKRYAQ